MTCREFTDFIIDYSSAELSEPSRAVFERHLARCAQCRAYLANYAATVALGRGAFEDAAAPVPADVPDELVEAILHARSA